MDENTDATDDSYVPNQSIQNNQSQTSQSMLSSFNKPVKSDLSGYQTYQIPDPGMIQQQRPQLRTLKYSHCADPQDQPSVLQI